MRNVELRIKNYELRRFHSPERTKYLRIGQRPIIIERLFRQMDKFWIFYYGEGKKNSSGDKKV